MKKASSPRSHLLCHFYSACSAGQPGLCLLCPFYETSQQELEQDPQLSEQEALEREGADISEALLLSKSEDPVVIFRLTKTSELWWWNRATGGIVIES